MSLITGISSKYLGEVERGRKNVSVAVVEKVSTALTVEISDLFDFDHGMGKDELRKRINALISRASERELQTIFRVLKSILE